MFNNKNTLACQEEVIVIINCNKSKKYRS